MVFFVTILTTETPSVNAMPFVVLADVMIGVEKMGKAEEEEEDGESTWIAPSEDSPLPISPSSFRFAPSPLVELDDARDDDEKEPTGAVVDAEAVDKETTKGEATIDLEDIDLEDIVSFTDRWMRPSTPPPPVLSAEDDESRSFLGEDEDGLLR